MTFDSHLITKVLCMQERAEDYIESLAFVSLLNTIFEAFDGRVPEQGRPYLQFTDFVRLELLGQMEQRTYRYAIPGNESHL